MSDLFTDLTDKPFFVNSAAFILASLFILLLVRSAQFVATNKIEDKELRYRTRKAFSLAGYAFGLIVAIAIFSDQMRNLAVIIGALSVGIGFALRELIQSLIGWAVVSFAGLYKPGDRIQMGGVMGDVMDIGPLTTTLMECGAWVNSDLYNGRVAHLSNSLVLKENVLNYTSDLPFLWDELVVPIRTDSDYRLARTIIEAAGKSIQKEITSAAKESWANFVRHHRANDAMLDSVVTMNFDANWIEFTLRYIVDYRTRRSVKDKLFSNILSGFEETGGKVKIASPSMQLTELPPLSLQPGREARHVAKPSHAQ